MKGSDELLISLVPDKVDKEQLKKEKKELQERKKKEAAEAKKESAKKASVK